jgi:hypothetical protein
VSFQKEAFNGFSEIWADFMNDYETEKDSKDKLEEEVKRLKRKNSSLKLKMEERRTRCNDRVSFMTRYTCKLIETVRHLEKELKQATKESAVGTEEQETRISKLTAKNTQLEEELKLHKRNIKNEILKAVNRTLAEEVTEVKSEDVTQVKSEDMQSS